MDVLVLERLAELIFFKRYTQWADDGSKKINKLREYIVSVKE